MSRSENLTPFDDQLFIAAPTFPLAVSKSELVSSSERSVFISSLQPIYPSLYERDYKEPSLPSSPSQLEAYAEPLLADFCTFISMSEPEEVEVDAEVWTVHTSHTDHGAYTYYTIQVPTSNRNVLIAHSRQIDDIFINVPDSDDHRWPILTSKKHTVDVIPADFEPRMGSINHFLDKSAEYFRPYKRYVKRRCYGNSMFCCMPVPLYLVLVAIHECFMIKYDFVLWELGAILLFTLIWSLLLNRSVKRGLANGVEALKVCGKYEQSMLPSNIKVILGPYGAYWKFVIRN